MEISVMLCHDLRFKVFSILLWRFYLLCNPLVFLDYASGLLFVRLVLTWTFQLSLVTCSIPPPNVCILGLFFPQNTLHSWIATCRLRWLSLVRLRQQNLLVRCRKDHGSCWNRPFRNINHMLKAHFPMYFSVLLHKTCTKMWPASCNDDPE